MAAIQRNPRLTLLQCDFSFLLFLPPSSLSLSLCPLLPLSPGSLVAEQRQCSLSKITRHIKANKQTPALRQLQMRANLYTINKRRSSFNLPLHLALCSPPPFFLPSSSASSLLPNPPFCVLPISVLAALLGWAQRQGKLTDASIIHRSPLLSLSLSVCVCLSLQRSVYLQGLERRVWGWKSVLLWTEFWFEWQAEEW